MDVNLFLIAFRVAVAHGIFVIVENAIARAVENLARRQEARGSWAGDYGGPMFLLPMYVGLTHAAGRPVDERRRRRMLEYLASAQREDGSLGLHAEDTQGSMFTTVLGYVALRILGTAPDDPRAARMLRWIHANGSPLGAAPWGKHFLCVLNLYDWRGIHPVPPELWLLPYAAPFHPARLWCHCRQVYLPMAWLYGTRSAVPAGDLIRALRAELYQGRYAAIAWEAQRNVLAATDRYTAPSLALRAVNRALDGLERLVPRSLRRRALDECLRHIQFEDRTTSFIRIGPVNAVLNTLVHCFRRADAEVERSFTALEGYLWDGHDGMKMQSYNSSELWDTAFALQAVLAAGGHDPVVRRAYTFVRDNQILDDVPELEAHYRHRSRGGWPFSNRPHGWPITDCTAEGLKCALALESKIEASDRIPPELLEASVGLLQSWQNQDGGWATYELKRGGAWLERLNPSEVFGDIMVDYSYVECTSAVLQALAQARTRFPHLEGVDRAIARGGDFLRTRQRADGSFEGSWAVCFTYGTWFGVSGLVAAGARRDDPALARAVDFLVGRQKPDGSWGESGQSCRERRYVQHSRGQVVQTAWALSALVRAGAGASEPARRAARFLVGRQEVDGSWARESLVGVFNKTCLINYDNYRHYFPLWALAEWRDSHRHTD
ncbi:MAG TPA: terpene cyclase/mutase family protein [bacterium]|nr:terpene cyclase/mutase family protein [bacterium]